MWTALTPQDLYTHLAAPQLDPLRTSHLAPEQDDPLPRLIASITALIRAELRANPTLRLDPDPQTLPPELHLPAAALIIEAAQARIAGLPLSPEQQRLAEQARLTITRAASGQIRLSPPDATSPAAAPRSSLSAGARRRQATGRHLAGF